MPTATRTKDLPSHQANLAIVAKKKSQFAQTEVIKGQLAGKIFNQLAGPAAPMTQEERDLLKAVALRLGLIDPD